MNAAPPHRYFALKTNICYGDDGSLLYQQSPYMGNNDKLYT